MFAPVLLRASAMLIDLAILVVLGLGVSALLGDTQLKQRETYAVVVVMAAVYNVAFLATRSATPGKMAMGLYVGDAQGRPLAPDAAVLRYLVQVVGGLLFGIGTVVSLVLVLVDPQRRAVHDRVARTRVFLGRPDLGQRVAS